MQQLTIFGELNESVISIDDVASSIKVSTATVRNWIKTGYLIQSGKNQVSVESVKQFNAKIAGSQKLVARANKSQKDDHNHDDISYSIDLLLENKSIDGALVSDQYEQLLSNAYKNKEGIYYTPDEIAQRFFEHLPTDCGTLTFCDPCCGSGNFLVAALKKGFKPENIYGFDLDPIAIKITKKRIFDISGYKTNNIHQQDFLDVQFSPHDDAFDVIFTNPPWGKKLEKSRKNKLAAALSAGNSQDTSAFFFFQCLKHLKKKGLLGLLLQEAFFNIATFEDARKKSLSLQIISLIDFGKPFKGLITKARGIVLKNTVNNDLTNVVAVQIRNTQHLRTQASFINKPKSILDFTCSQENAEVISHLFSIDHVKLAGKARFGLGIVTGNNDKHCINSPKSGYIPVYKGFEIFKDKVSEATNYIPSDFSQYQQVAPISLYLAKEKLIYRFISSDLVFYHDTAQRFILNSANMLALNDNFPINIENLSHLLNSKVLNWLFKSLFDTHKILRADIESLPIHFRYFEKYSVFSESDYLNYLDIEEANGTYRVKK
ncbi:MAG: N-6 DNA methylase [Methylotenera sp.]|uniref:N-6 DNA methylase n=1 Tax=Methylotenera sp. TaxID=2051956 RepID=UPI00273193B8|nr:N-6 DNA methylase [Methylotenera sp.]MDP1523148.1 N-6 DNA methylase [Methylotenera sp.]